MAEDAKLKVGARTQMEGRKSSITVLDSESKGPEWGPEKDPGTLCSQDKDIKNL